MNLKTFSKIAERGKRRCPFPRAPIPKTKNLAVYTEELTHLISLTDVPASIARFSCAYAQEGSLIDVIALSALHDKTFLFGGDLDLVVATFGSTAPLRSVSQVVLISQLFFNE
jgi:hypothetical protein